MISAQLDEIRSRMRAALERAGRAPDSATLIAVAKTHPA
ncbi:MAG: YggS family pyridoxal phosphate-dependent enzyme, partial [Alphaproteobacteria bacterium]|nr:YggS family pyridoxal phosphate-dependent enzyme [Alphaproteobacteria bacterium]